MAYARIYPEAEKLTRNVNKSRSTDFDQSYVSRARTVLKYSINGDLNGEKNLRISIMMVAG